MKKRLTIFLFLFIQSFFNYTSTAQSVDGVEQQVADTERAFAKTMADRDLDAFASFIADDAVFWSGEEALRGKEQVVAAWSGYFDGDIAPFAWKPETVLVLQSEDLALSTGPVWNTQNVTYSYFTSVWKKNETGKWQIVFDKGQKYCE